jgi:hypothetical protein
MSSIIAVCMIICAIAEFYGFDTLNEDTEYLIKESIWRRDFDAKDERDFDPKYTIKDPLQFDD